MYRLFFNGIKVVISFSYIFFLIKQFFVPVSPLMAASVHVFMATSLIFCFKPIEIKDGSLKYLTRLLDVILIAVSLLICAHFITDMDRLETRLEMIDD